ncbi:uncharacterized protein NEMAJ01_1754 [Nematocida major]|uniref:uncharacterized protein n=1 Tax=Nematocida major TaxID=1912982 RepID=UPI002007D523|nr:uncharacterized protein NEMAJ01_1754 [Nematocida major]KAH9386858.1 hypothetical protein NEMAJ01_1754 [Nematocida major]
MKYEYNREVYTEYVSVMEASGIEVPDELEGVYKRYIKAQMEEIPYTDNSILRMYTLVFFLKYVKQMQGAVKFKSIYSKLEMQKKLITRAMETVDIDFGLERTNFTLVEDWSSLYSINKKGGCSVVNLSNTPPSA